MAKLNEARPEVFVELGGKRRQLRFGFWAISQLESLLGKNPLVDRVDIRSLKNQLAYAWAGLIEGSPELDGEIIDGKPSREVQSSLKLVASWIKPTEFQYVMELVGKAYGNAMGELSGSTKEKKEETPTQE